MAFHVKLDDRGARPELDIFLGIVEDAELRLELAAVVGALTLAYFLFEGAHLEAVQADGTHDARVMG